MTSDRNKGYPDDRIAASERVSEMARSGGGPKGRGTASARGGETRAAGAGETRAAGGRETRRVGCVGCHVMRSRRVDCVGCHPCHTCVDPLCSVRTVCATFPHCLKAARARRSTCPRDLERSGNVREFVENAVMHWTYSCVRFSCIIGGYCISVTQFFCAR